MQVDQAPVQMQAWKKRGAKRATFGAGDTGYRFV